jgi:hypothetical protein
MVCLVGKVIIPAWEGASLMDGSRFRAGTIDPPHD